MQGAEEGQEESRALVGAFPGEGGGLKGRPDNQVRLPEQQHNKQVCGDVGLCNRTHACWLRMEEGLEFLREGAASLRGHAHWSSSARGDPHWGNHGKPHARTCMHHPEREKTKYSSSGFSSLEKVAGTMQGCTPKQMDHSSLSASAGKLVKCHTHSSPSQ